MSSLSTLLAELPSPNVPPHLFEKTCLAIKTAQKNRLKRLTTLLTTGFLLSLAYVTWNWSAFADEFASSSFFELIRLAFSDTDIALAHTHELFWGLLENIPLESLVLATLMCFLGLGAVTYAASLRNHTRHTSLS